MQLWFLREFQKQIILDSLSVKLCIKKSKLNQKHSSHPQMPKKSFEKNIELHHEKYEVFNQSNFHFKNDPQWSF